MLSEARKLLFLQRCLFFYFYFLFTVNRFRPEIVLRFLRSATFLLANCHEMVLWRGHFSIFSIVFKQDAKNYQNCTKNSHKTVNFGFFDLKVLHNVSCTLLYIYTKNYENRNIFFFQFVQKSWKFNTTSDVFCLNCVQKILKIGPQEFIL